MATDRAKISFGIQGEVEDLDCSCVDGRVVEGERQGGEEGEQDVR